MAEYNVVAQIECQCGTYITVRAIQGTYGGTHKVPCWNCNREIKLSGNQGYSDGKKAPTTIIAREVRKK